MNVPDAQAAVEALFNPRSITILGASESYNKWGNIIPGNILGGGYQGQLYLVNPRGGTIHGRPVYRSVEEIPDRLDLVMMTIPAEKAEGMFEACGRAGAKVAIVISGGFSESSPEGRELEGRMVERAHASGLRVVGPNTMGIYTSPHSLTALMPPVRPIPGSIAFAAQSGNLGTQMLGFGAYRGVGFSRFVCIGNECDLDFVDYLEYFARDEARPGSSSSTWRGSRTPAASSTRPGRSAPPSPSSSTRRPAPAPGVPPPLPTARPWPGAGRSTRG